MRLGKIRGFLYDTFQLRARFFHLALLNAMDASW